MDVAATAGRMGEKQGTGGLSRKKVVETAAKDQPETVEDGATCQGGGWDSGYVLIWQRAGARCILVSLSGEREWEATALSGRGRGAATICSKRGSVVAS